MSIVVDELLPSLVVLIWSGILGRILIWLGKGIGQIPILDQINETRLRDHGVKDSGLCIKR